MSDPYRPGQQPQWPDQTTRIPPVQSRQAPPRGPRPPQQPQPKDKRREYLLKGAGLLLVAVVSGMLWWLIQQGNTTPPSDPSGNGKTGQPSAGKFAFTRHEKVQKPLRDSNCEEHSYQGGGKPGVKSFFKDHKCTGLARELYTTTADGKTAYVSVSVVEMSSAQEAQDLQKLTDSDGTGNVSDLIRDKVVKVQGLNNLSGGGFASKAEGNHVIIVEADFEGGSKNTDEPTLDGIATDAIRLGDEIRQG
ncbi:hypothetical protein [Actinocrispum sp. NPDC049592]|uniref:hypothetical protein n=1 Tax=Actinocrispum sp. NPDC049592 TaxID=3154835 RepID=UPI003426B06F